MSSLFSRFAAAITVGLLAAACSAAATPSPTSTPVASPPAPATILVDPTPVATEVPPGTTSPLERPGASGAAKLSGAIFGLFSIRGDECPTPEHPDGLLSGMGENGETALEVTIRPDATARFVFYPTPGDESDSIAATVPASPQVAGDGWAVALQASPAGIGPVTLDVEWTCDAATATASPGSLGSGHVIHVNLAVPLASAAALGSTCDATALRATGPVAATIPGSRLSFFDFDQPLDMFDPADEPNETPPEGSSPRATVVPEEPNETKVPFIPLGEQTVPETGTLVKPISDDPGFPAACLFSFDVSTTADVKKAYVFSVGSVYFPVPLILRSDLEAAGWVANIGVNP